VLETLEVAEYQEHLQFRMPVQWVNRPDLDFRGFCGFIPSGTVRVGDRLVVLPSGRESTVKGILGPEGELATAVAGQSVTLTLNDEIDVSRGDVLATVDAPAQVGDRFRCTIVWMHEAPMFPARPYLLK